MVSVTTHFSARRSENIFPSGPPSSWLPHRLHGEPRKTIPAAPKFPDTGAGGGGAETDPAVKAAVEILIQHARAAVAIEFTTIPMYLYATWSIKGDNGGPGSKARYCILGRLRSS